MEPMTMMAIAAVIAGGMNAIGTTAASSSASKMKEKEIEEMGKRRKSEFASNFLERQRASAQGRSERQNEMAKTRAQNLQGIAQNIKLGGRRG